MPQVKTFFLTPFFSCKKCLLLFGIVLLFPIHNHAQQNVKDSLTGQIRKIRSQPKFSAKDTLYIDLLNALGRELRFYKSDSLFQLSQQALDLSRSMDYKVGENYALLGLGDYHSDKGSHAKGIQYYQSSLSLGKTIKNRGMTLRRRTIWPGNMAIKATMPKR